MTLFIIIKRKYKGRKKGGGDHSPQSAVFSNMPFAWEQQPRVADSTPSDSFYRI